MYRAFKYRIYPTNEQIRYFNEVIDSTRFIWNKMLEDNINEYKDSKKFIWAFSWLSKLVELKQEHNWLKNPPSQSLQQVCIDLEKALKMTSKKKSKRFGFPKYKHKKSVTQSFCIPKQNKRIKPTKTQIKIPKIGWIRWNKHRPLQGKIKYITIKKENDIWWCVCLCKLIDVKPITKGAESQVVGLDLGLTDFATLSNKTVIKTPKFYRMQQKKLRRRQQILARRIKGSKNREKARKQLNRTHYEIKCKRYDFLHKISNTIAKDYLFVSVEDLNVSGMKRNKYLSKSISDQGWAMFISYLNYKTETNGGKLVKIDRYAPSSKTCSSCGNKQDIPLHKRTYKCNSCGFEINRDLNAAINIKRWGIDQLNRCGTHQIHACEDTNGEDISSDMSSYVSLKQEKFFTSGKEAA